MLIDFIGGLTLAADVISLTLDTFTMSVKGVLF